jgi:hypothetical protein
MLFVDRSDGSRVRGLDAVKAVLPYVLRRRSEAAVFFSRDIEVEGAMAYLRRKNQEAGGERYSLFGVLIAAAVRTIALKPRLNRFVHRRAVYARRGISVSFIVKKSLTEASSEANAKIGFEPEDDLERATAKINAGIEAARAGSPARGDAAYRLYHSLPFGKATASLVFRLLDRFNVAPRRALESDPLFTSVYFANLGSIGLDPPYHQLYDWGTASVFMVVGRIFQKAAGGSGEEGARGGAQGRRHYVTVKFAVDERIADGLYFAHAVALFQKLVSRPECLEAPADLSEAEA